MPRQSPEAAAYAGTGSRIKPPADIVPGSPEYELFCDLVLNLPPTHFQLSDSPLLAAYCRAAIQERVASAELAAAGFVVGDKPSPWLPIQQAATRVISTYSRMLKLNPAARSPVPAKAAGNEPVSYYDRVELERRAFRDDSEPN